MQQHPCEDGLLRLTSMLIATIEPERLSFFTIHVRPIIYVNNRSKTLRDREITSVECQCSRL